MYENGAIMQDPIENYRMQDASDQYSSLPNLLPETILRHHN